MLIFRVFLSTVCSFGLAEWKVTRSFLRRSCNAHLYKMSIWLSTLWHIEGEAQFWGAVRGLALGATMHGDPCREAVLQLRPGVTPTWTVHPQRVRNTSVRTCKPSVTPATAPNNISFNNWSNISSPQSDQNAEPDAPLPYSMPLPLEKTFPTQNTLYQYII
jgi:hypothetical protein